jgi:hypothetical protein
MNAADVYRLRAIEARLGLDRTAADRATESERRSSPRPSATPRPSG